MSPYVHAKRVSMTPQQRAKIFAAHDGRCHVCSRKLGPADDWDVSHVIALENGGTDEDDNKAVICEWCHAERTKDDHAAHTRGKRAYERHTVPARFRKSRSWR